MRENYTIYYVDRKIALFVIGFHQFHFPFIFIKKNNASVFIQHCTYRKTGKRFKGGNAFSLFDFPLDRIFRELTNDGMISQKVVEFSLMGRIDEVVNRLSSKPSECPVIGCKNGVLFFFIQILKTPCCFYQPLYAGKLMLFLLPDGFGNGIVPGFEMGLRMQ